jgi:hypothetical protein
MFAPFFSSIPFNFKYKNILNIAFLVLMLAATPNIKSYPKYNSFHSEPYSSPNYLPYIYAVRNLEIPQTPTITFLVSEILPIYMGKNFYSYIQYQKDQPFDKEMEKFNFGIIDVSPTLLNDKRYTSDTTWTNFLNNYESLGWEKLQLPGKKEYIIYRKDILPK